MAMQGYGPRWRSNPIPIRFMLWTPDLLFSLAQSPSSDVQRPLSRQHRLEIPSNSNAASPRSTKTPLGFP